MLRVIEIEQSQDNPNKKERLALFMKVLERVRREDCLELAKTIFDYCPNFMNLDPLERKELVLRFTIRSMLPESMQNDKFRKFVEAWFKARYEIVDAEMSAKGLDKLPWEEQDATRKAMLQWGYTND